MFKKLIFGGSATALVAILAVALLSDPPVSPPELGDVAGQTASSDGTEEGIKVHGHWVIDIRGPNGKLEHRHEFDNDLVAAGAEGLSRILTFGLDLGGWRVVFDGSNSTGPCVSSFNPAVTDCVIMHPDDFVQDDNSFSGLSYDATPTGGFSLIGSAVAQKTGVIDEVETEISWRDPLGGGSGGIQFTRANNFGSIAVQVGQTIQIKVTISFS